MINNVHKSLVVLVLCAIIGVNVYAEENIKIEQETENMEESIQGDEYSKESDLNNKTLIGYQEVLEIDDQNVYEGMNMSYSEGYAPLIANDKAVIVLPLCLSTNVQIDSIKVVPDLGLPENSPFVFRNYQKTFVMTAEHINGSNEEREVFLVKFELDLKENRINGVFPVDIRVNYVNNGMATTQNFCLYIEINDGKNIEEELSSITDSAKIEDKPTSEPKVIIKQCKNMASKIEAGSTFSVIVILENTNKLKAVQNMTVAVSCESPDISLMSDGNVFYFEYLGAKKELQLPLSFYVEEGAVIGKTNLVLDMQYDNPNAVSLSSSGKIEINIAQKNEIELEIGQMVNSVNAGDSFEIPVQVMNLGRSKNYNVRCNIDVPGLSTEKSLFLGNIDGGTALSGNLVVFAGMVNSEAENDEDKYGQTKGNIIVLYEDENGETSEIRKEISVEIMPLKINVSEKDTEEETVNVVKQLIVSGIILVAVMAVIPIIPVIIYRYKKRKKHAM